MSFKLKKYYPDIQELILRLRICAVFFILASIFGYFIKERLLFIIFKPLLNLQKNNELLEFSRQTDISLIYTNLIDGFLSYLKLSLVFGFITTIPLLMWQIFKFISPGLYLDERKVASLILICSPILGLIGFIFAYYVVIPNAWRFFYSFTGDNLVLLPKLNEYIGLVTSVLIGFGIAFQLPIVIILLHLSKILNIHILTSYRKVVIFLIFVVSGIVTPPDILSQFMLAVPLIIMYEFAIITCKLMTRKC